MSIRRQLGDLAKSLDSSAVGSFLSKGASEADFTTISYSDVSGTPSVVADSAVATSIIDSAYVSSRVTTVAAGLDSATTINLLDSNYMAARSGGGAGFYVYNYDATAGQTTFQDSDAAGNVMSYSADGIIVFYNGVMLPTADYTADDGTSVVLSSAADSQDVVTIAKWSVGGGAGGGSGSLAGTGYWYGDRGLIAGGDVPSNVIQYIDITTPGNATDFGDLLGTKQQFGASGVSNGTVGVFAGGGSGYNVPDNVIEYVIVSTLGNATDFGDRTVSSAFKGSASDATYGLFAGGYTGANQTNVIDYITIETPGDATDFGDLTLARWGIAGSNDATRGLFGMGNGLNVIDYVTIASPSNATDFGDMTQLRMRGGAAGDGTYVTFVGGNYSGSNTTLYNIIDYVTVQTIGNATDFGDLTQSITNCSCTGNGTRGVRAGGDTGQSNVIDYWTFATPGNATDFGDLLTATAHITATSGSPS